MKKRIFLSLVVVAMAAVNAGAQKLAVTKGQKLETLTTTKMSMEVMGQNIDNESTSSSNVELKEVSADGYLFANTVKRMTMKGSGMGQDMSFDSDKKEDLEGQVGQVVKDKIGAVQEIQVDRLGKVTAIKEAVDSKPAGGMSGMMSLTGDVAKGQPYPLLIQLPGRAIKSGDSWTDSSGTVETIKTITTYIYKGIGADGAAMVSFTGTLAKSGTVEQNGMEIQMDMTEVTKGESSYDAASGLLKTTTSSAEIKGTLGIMGQNAPIVATVVSTIAAKKL
jgi:hypothetical protein